MAKEKKKNLRSSGIPVSWFAIPLLIITIIVHAIIVIMIADINNSSRQLSQLMQRSGVYQIDATSMQASNTVLSETCSTYLQSPVNEDDTVNYAILIVYANELNSDRRSPKVLERFRSYEVSKEIFECIVKASGYSEQIIEIQLHAISLMDSVYPLPDIPQLSAIAKVDLTQEELDMSNDERVTYARQLIYTSEYAQLRHSVADNIDNCNLLLQNEFTKSSNATEKHVSTMRNILWVVISLIVVILSSAYIMFYELIVRPLRNYAKDIAANKSIKRPVGMREMQQLANAFNGLWNSRNRIESMLRTAAENDALTGLPNRYCMEQYLLNKIGAADSCAAVLFDVDFLKETNDSLGHLAGDKLLCQAAECIKECFCIKGVNNCYRVGGDEFVALFFGNSEEDIIKRIEKFKAVKKRENISVSVGYAFTENVDSNSIINLMEEADKNMYENKKQTHDKSKKL